MTVGSAINSMKFAMSLNFVGVIVFAVWLWIHPFTAKAGLPTWVPALGPSVGMILLSLNGLSCRRKLKHWRERNVFTQSNGNF
jgi:hypothetical protein